LAVRDSSPGGCRKPELQSRHQTKGLWRLDISPKILSPASERVQCLGDMPWVSRATAMWPDTRYVASDDGNVNTGDDFTITRCAGALYGAIPFTGSL